MTVHPTSQRPDVSSGDRGATVPAADVGRVLRLALRVAVAMLGSGAQTDDVETAIDTIGAAYGIDTIQRSVTFSGIAISHDPPGSGPPTTLLYTVPERASDFARLAATSSVVRRIKDGRLEVAEAEAALDELDRQPSPYGRVVAFAAPAVSAAGSTVVFGGALLDAVATLAVALVIQPALSSLERSTLPPFFRTFVGVATSTLLVAVLVGLGLPIVGGLVLTGSLLRFLPGYALVSGFRDLIDQSIISGSARLAEALLLGAGAAAGTALALVAAGSFGVHLTLVKTGPEDWGATVAGLAALLAVGGYAIRLGDPRRATVSAAILGAIAWLAVIRMRDVGIDPAVATLVSALAIGVISRMIAVRVQSPATLWAVPAVLPLLPGLQIVEALLAPTDAARVIGLVGAAGTAFLIGAGVASGDIVVTTFRRMRARVTPAIDTVTTGIGVNVVAPVDRYVRERAGSVFTSRDRDDP
ncbi:MAG TPA: threonine/serine exporter family protein [Candidatus Limnocylindrales bacterium]|nr:threonine/serine exporter family protein [Candidatus Limnocylindrales bacterium]